MKRPRGIFCLARNESVFLPIWVGYYRRFFDPSDILVFDCKSVDDSAEKLSVARLAQVIPFEVPELVGFPMYTTLVCGIQRKLLELYETVVFTETDQILFHPAGLGGYLDSFNREGVCATGYEIHHRPEIEAPIDLSQPILSQRRFWHRNDTLDSPLIARIPLEWSSSGLLTASNVTDRDPNLLVLHLQKMDYQTTFGRNNRTLSYKSVKDGIGGSPPRKHLLFDEDFDRWLIRDLYRCDQDAVATNRSREGFLIDEEFDRWFHQESLSGNAIEEIPLALRLPPLF